MSYWTWDSSTFDSKYNVRDPEKTVYLPRFTPTLESGRDFYANCGEITYDISNPDPEAILNVQPLTSNEVTTSYEPYFKVFTTEPDKATPDYVVFELGYIFTSTAESVLYEATFDYPETLEFFIADPCFEADFSRPFYLTYYD